MSSTLTLENVLYEKKGAIAYVTLNRLKVMNALNQKTWENLRSAFEDARDDSAIRGAILTGAGDKAFIAGADISELATITALEAKKSSNYGQEVLNLIENLGKPVIAAVNGYALAADAKRRWPVPSGSLQRMQNLASQKSGGESFLGAVERNVCRGWSVRAGRCS